MAILKHLGSNDDVMRPLIFAQRQIARAAELGVGVSSAEDIDLVAADENSNGLVKTISNLLAKG